jgi:hypothetical protein
MISCPELGTAQPQLVINFIVFVSIRLILDHCGSFSLVDMLTKNAVFLKSKSTFWRNA